MLGAAAKASKTAALLCLIWIGVTVMWGLFSFVNMLGGWYNEMYLISSFLDLAATGIFVIPILAIFKFSSRITGGIASNNPTMIDEGYGALKKAAKLVFIFAIIKMGLFLLSFTMQGMYELM